MTEAFQRARMSEAAWLIAGTWVLALAAMCMTVFVGTSDYPAQGYVRAALMAIVGAALSAAVWSAASRRPHGTVGRVAFFGCSILVATAIQLIIDLWSADLVTAALDYPQPVQHIVSDSRIRAFFMGILLSSNISIYATAHAFFAMAAIALSGAVDTRERDRMLAEAQASASEAQLSALRYQLNPHFLFNTLNALHSLVESGRAKDAGTMIARLSDFLRSTLTDSGGGVTSLEDELATIQDYLAIEAVRFGDRLSVRFDCPPEVREAAVPSFILQPLVENALKHGVAPALSPVEVEIGARSDGEDLLIWVANDVVTSAQSASARGAGVGLRNTHERLALGYGGRAALTTDAGQTSYRATVRLPLEQGGAA